MTSHMEVTWTAVPIDTAITSAAIAHAPMMAGWRSKNDFCACSSLSRHVWHSPPSAFVTVTYVGAPHVRHAPGTQRPVFFPSLNQSATGVMKSAGQLASVVMIALLPCSSKVTAAPGPGLAAHVKPTRRRTSLDFVHASANASLRFVAVLRTRLRNFLSVPGTMGDVNRQSFCPSP